MLDHDPFNNSFQQRDDRATCFIIFNKITILATLPIQLLFLYKFFYFGQYQSDLIFLLYAIFELYFTITNFFFIVSKNELKKRFMRLKFVSFMIPFISSCAINTLVFLFGIYALLDSDALKDDGFGSGIRYVIIAIPAIALVRNALFFLYFRLIDQNSHQKYSINHEDLEFVHV